MTAISRNIAAQLYSQTATVVIQIGLVPILISCWGVVTYGVWLTLTAIPTYLMLSDFGFTFVAKNDMSIRVSSGDRFGALETYQSVLVLMLAICSAILALAYVAIAWIPIDSIFNTGNETMQDVRLVLICQVTSVVLYQIFLLFNAGIRCEGRAATEISVTATSRLAEAGSWAIAAILGGSIAEAALTGMFVRATMLVIVGIWVHKKTPWLRLGVSSANIERIKELLTPSVNYMLIPMSSAIFIQAPLIVLGALSTPAIVALFSVTRTVARLGMSAANVLHYSFTPEYSFKYGGAEYGAFLENFKRHLKVILLGCTLFLAIGSVTLPFGVSIVSAGEIQPDFLLGIIMVLSVCAEAIWRTFLSPLSATNQHVRPAREVAAVSISCFIMFFFTQGVHQMSALITISHIVLCVMLWRNLKPVLQGIKSKEGLL